MQADRSDSNVDGWELGTLLAVEGKEDCTDPRCRNRETIRTEEP